MPAMTIERDPPETQRQPGEGEEERPGVLRRLRVPLLFVAACLLGFLLEFGVGLPGTPVWLGVIVAEIAIGLVAWRSNQRAGSPGREDPGVDATAEVEAPLEREPARPRKTRQSQLKPPPEPPPPVQPEPQSLPLPHVPVVRPVPPPPEPKSPKAESAEAPSTGIEEALDAAVAAAQDAVSQPRKRNRRGRAERVDEPPATRPDATQGEKAATEQPVAAAEEPVAPAEPRRRSRRRRVAKPADERASDPPSAARDTTAQEAPEAPEATAADPPAAVPEAPLAQQPAPSVRTQEVTARPPADRNQQWLAEIVWRESDGGGAFVAVARNRAGDSVKVGEAPLAEWPPKTSESMDAYGAVVTRLEEALVRCGWQPAPPGKAWYARRFAWGVASAAAGPGRPPIAGPRPEAAAAPTRVSAPAQAPGRPPSHDWPEGTDEVIRCEIKWMSAYRRSRFDAVMYPPGRKRPTTVASSDTFKWMFKADADWRDPAQLEAVRALRAALIADGWEEVGEGPVWYGRRFVWRGDGEPPQRLGAS